MNEYTDIQLQLWLAKQLPELIGTRLHDPEIPDPEKAGTIRWINNGSFGPRVTSREWDYIVRQLVTRLTDEQIETWVSHIRTLVGGNLHDMPRRTWQTGVVALSKTLNSQIE